jgi:hypothetical protein
MLYAFDLLELDGVDYRRLPLKERLSQLVDRRLVGIVMNDHTDVLPRCGTPRRSICGPSIVTRWPLSHCSACGARGLTSKHLEWEDHHGRVAGARAPPRINQP